MNVLEIQTEEVVRLECEVCLLVSPRHFCAFSLPFFSPSGSIEASRHALLGNVPWRSICSQHRKKDSSLRNYIRRGDLSVLVVDRVRLAQIVYA